MGSTTRKYIPTTEIPTPKTTKSPILRTTRPPRTTPRPSRLTTRRTTKRTFPPQTTTKKTTTAPPTTTEKPIKTTNKPRGSILFGGPIITEKPKLKPKTTTKSPAKGKQLSKEPEPKAEPSGKEWGGNPRYHAFHRFHYDRGDGRSRIFGRRTSRNRKARSVSEENYTIEVSKMPVRLFRTLHVVSPIDESIPEADELVFSNSSVESLCVSYLHLVAIISLFFVLLLIIILFVIINLRLRRKLSSK